VVPPSAGGIGSRYGKRLYRAWVSDGSSGGAGGSDAAGLPQCSARGCRASATYDLSWRNPGLHEEARVKHWVACEEHRDTLADFLRRRRFLLAVDPLDGDGDGDGAAR
jgi:hypothetical protein